MSRYRGMKMGSKKQTKLYNVIFPIWILWLFPVTWIVVLPANFLIDLAVVVITLKVLSVEHIKEIAKKVIFKVWIFGFVSDFIGTVAMFSVNFMDMAIGNHSVLGEWWYKYLTNAVTYRPFENIYSILWVSACVVITGYFIYLFNYKVSFKKVDLDEEVKKKLALSLAVFTAPYLFYLPTSLFF